jgi:hypothetical protein
MGEPGTEALAYMGEPGTEALAYGMEGVGVTWRRQGKG